MLNLVDYFSTDESYIFPGYTRHPTIIGNRSFEIMNYPMLIHDIGLIKLSKPIRSGDRGQGFAIENSICLPPEDYREDIGSYALIAGYGYMGANKDSDEQPLQMTYMRRAGYVEIKPFSDFIYVNNGGNTCPVSI